MIMSFNWIFGTRFIKLISVAALKQLEQLTDQMDSILALTKRSLPLTSSNSPYYWGHYLSRNRRTTIIKEWSSANRINVSDFVVEFTPNGIPAVSSGFTPFRFGPTTRSGILSMKYHIMTGLGQWQDFQEKLVPTETSRWPISMGQVHILGFTGPSNLRDNETPCEDLQFGTQAIWQ